MQQMQILYLNLGQDGHHRHNDTEDEVEADEDLVLCAVVRLSVVNVEEHHSSEGQGKVKDGEKEQG